MTMKTSFYWRYSKMFQFLSSSPPRAEAWGHLPALSVYRQSTYLTMLLEANPRTPPQETGVSRRQKLPPLVPTPVAVWKTRVPPTQMWDTTVDGGKNQPRQHHLFQGGRFVVLSRLRTSDIRQFCSLISCSRNSLCSSVLMSFLCFAFLTAASF